MNKLLLVAFIFMISTVAQATRLSPYSGFGVGRNDVSCNSISTAAVHKETGHDDDNGGSGGPVTTTGTGSLGECSDDTVWKAFVGVTPWSFYESKLNIGGELTYADLGERGVIEADAVSAEAVIRWNIIPQWQVAGSIGYAFWDAVDDGTDLTYGIFVEWDAGAPGAFSTRLEFETYEDVDNSDIDVIGLSAIYNW